MLANKGYCHVLILALTALWTSVSQSESPDASAIVARADTILNPRGITRTRMTLEVERPNEQTLHYGMEVLRLGSELMRLTFLAPERMRGQVLLRRGESQWLYFPTLQRTLKVPRRQSLAGSEFSYGDILNINLVAEYRAELSAAETGDPDTATTYYLILRAKTPEALYEEIHYLIRKSDFAPLKREYFTKSGHKLKTLRLTNHDSMTLPRQWEMSSVLNSTARTRLIIEHIEPANDVDEEAFSLAALRQG